MPWDNRREEWYAPQIIEGPREVHILDAGYISALNNKLFFRPTRGSDGFALYSTASRAKQQSVTVGEKPIKIRLYMEILSDQENGQ